MFDWIARIDVPSLVPGALVGTLVSTWYHFFLHRPKLQVCGSGSGSTTHIDLWNEPGLFGLILPETTILGRVIHGRKEFGHVVERNPANQCRAWLYDKESNRAIRPLWWRTSDGNFTQEVSIKSGEQVSLMVFARLAEEKRKYFVYDLLNK